MLKLKCHVNDFPDKNNVTDLLRQRLCKRGNYATVDESGVFRALSVALLPLLYSDEVNTSLVARQQL
jgi:hypothetical protein